MQFAEDGHGVTRFLTTFVLGAAALATALGLSGRAVLAPSGPQFSSAEACCGGARPPGRAAEGTGRNRTPSVVRPPTRPGTGRPPVGVRDQINAVNRQRQGRDAATGRTGADGPGGAGGATGTGGADGGTAIAGVARDASGRPMTPDQVTIDSVLGEAVLDDMFDRMAANADGKTNDELLRESYDEVLRDPRAAVERVLNNPNRQATEEENQAVRDAFDRVFGGTTANPGFSDSDGGSAQTAATTPADTGGDAASTPPPAKTPAATQGTGGQGQTADEFVDDLGNALRQAFPGLDGKGGGGSGQAASDAAETPSRPPRLTDASHAHGDDVDSDRADALRSPIITWSNWSKDKDGNSSRTIEHDIKNPEMVTETIVRRDGAQISRTYDSRTGDKETFTITWPDGMASTMEWGDRDISSVFRYPDGRQGTYLQQEVFGHQNPTFRETWTAPDGSKRERLTVKTGGTLLTRTTNADGTYTIQTFDNETGREVPSALSRNQVLGNELMNGLLKR